MLGLIRGVSSNDVQPTYLNGMRVQEQLIALVPTVEDYFTLVVAPLVTSQPVVSQPITSIMTFYYREFDIFIEGWAFLSICLLKVWSLQVSFLLRFWIMLEL